MNKSTNILAIMIKDHCKIEKLLDELEQKTNQEYAEMVKAFNKFEWELEKHVFAEEKAIFTNYNPQDVTEGYRMLPELTKQHNYIVNQLNNWRRDIRNKKTISDIFSFKQFIIRHKNYEEKEVYPRLDQALTEDQKIKIVEKIQEII